MIPCLAGPRMGGPSPRWIAPHTLRHTRRALKGEVSGPSLLPPPRLRHLDARFASSKSLFAIGIFFFTFSSIQASASSNVAVAAVAEPIEGGFTQFTIVSTPRRSCDGVTVTNSQG